MSAVTRLVTFVDVGEEDRDAGQISLSARHEAELRDGHRVLLLDDRGWVSKSLTTSREGDAPDETLDTWATTSVEDIEETARTAVGPDEPFGDFSQEDVERRHWTYLSDVLRRQGVVVDDPLDVKRLPHDVVLSERLLKRVGRKPSRRPQAAGT